MIRSNVQLTLFRSDLSALMFLCMYKPGEHDSTVMLPETHRFAIGTEIATHSSVVYWSIAHWNAGLTAILQLTAIYMLTKDWRIISPPHR